MRISDERQADPKEPGHCGVARHERLFFSMSPTGAGTNYSVPATVENLVTRLMAHGKGSFICSYLHDCVVKVEVMRLGELWRWEVRKGGEVVDIGLATMSDERGLELKQDTDGPIP